MNHGARCHAPLALRRALSRPLVPLRRQLLCFPKGNKPNQLSLFLAVPDAEDQPLGWQRSASFKLALLSDLGPEHDLVKDTQHTFLGSENDWGAWHVCPGRWT